MTAVPKLTGMRDLGESASLRLSRATQGLQDFLGSWGYTIVETPLLERTDLFLRKSGGELASRMYTFTDPGGHRVSLRPEFTSSVIRSFVEQGLPGPYPCRWQYAGPVFRYEEERPRHQFTQVGAELVGSAEPSADAEVLALVVRGLQALGFHRVDLVVGDIHSLNGFLDQFPLSERAKLFLLGSVPRLRKGSALPEDLLQEAEGLGLFPGLPQGPDGEPIELDLGGSSDQALRQALLQALLGRATTDPVGSRTQEAILSRYLRKLRGSDDPRYLRHAIEFLNRLSRVSGEPAGALDQAGRLASEYSLDDGHLANLQRVLEVFSHYSLKDTQLIVDFGLSRSIAYYTGVVFEARTPGGSRDDTGEPSSSISLCGGGRYDGLVKALGGEEDVPALGFAYTLEELLAKLPDGSDEPGLAQRKRSRVLVVPRRPEAHRAAFQVAETLRLGGERAEMELAQRDLPAAKAYARATGIDSVVIVEPDGETERRWVDDL